MNKLKIYQDDYYDDGHGKWKIIYKTKEVLNQKEIIKICKDWLLNDFLRYESQDYKDSFGIVSAEELTDGNIEICWHAGLLDDGDYDYYYEDLFSFEVEE